MQIYSMAPLAELMLVADTIRREQVSDPQVVTWQIDRNVNITNVCISGCKFCNFHCKPHQADRAYITTIDEYDRKIRETLALGGDQLLLQGGLHPKLGIDFLLLTLPLPYQLKKLAVLPGRISDFFSCPCSGSDSRNAPIPCFGGSQDVTLTYRKGSFETFGFKRLFCPLFQLLGKVGRRRHKMQSFSFGSRSHRMIPENFI